MTRTRKTAVRTLDREERRDLLRTAMAVTPHPEKPSDPIPLERFAAEVVLRDRKTVRDWLDGTAPVPALLVPRLQKIVREARERAAYVGEGDPSRILAAG